MKNKREVLVKLFLSTLYLSAFTFGGGLHTATFRGHQGRVLRPDRAILSGQS